MTAVPRALRRLATDAAAGLVAGAAGTTALNAVTYFDMALRGRPASELPAKSAARMAERAGIDLGEGAAAANRSEGLGAAMGIATGVGWGLVYAAARRFVAPPLPVGALVVGAAAMAGSDASLTAQGLTDPRSWGAKAWLADAVPHVAYGFALVAAYELAAGQWTRCSGAR